MTPFELSSLGDLGRFTVIAVDAGVRAVDGASAFDVLFIGTTSGRVLKLYHLKVHSRRIENTLRLLHVTSIATMTYCLIKLKVCRQK